MPRLVPLLLACALLGACGSADPKPAAQKPGEARAALRGAPAPLASLHAQGNELLGGGAKAFRARLEGLRGHPVVVNKWASWCPPCRAEFPYFQRQSVKRGKKIAFIGVDSNDNDAAARKFLKRFPVSYPSYRDGNSAVAAEMKAVQAFPTTAFYDRRGKLAYLHQGGYASERKLAKDIERYAR